MTDSTHEYETAIEAPLADVWHVLAGRFDEIGDWSTGVPKSWATDAIGDDDAPIQARVCQGSTSRFGFDDVTETIIDYGEDPYYFTYRASGTPKWMGVAMNTWHAESVDEATTRVYFEPELQSTGLIGRVMMPLFMLVGRRMAHDTLDDLKVYVETGKPSARKQKKSAKQRS